MDLAANNSSADVGKDSWGDAGDEQSVKSSGSKEIEHASPDVPDLEFEVVEPTLHTSTKRRVEHDSPQEFHSEESSKRQRQSSFGDLCQHATFWEPDGNVIVQVENTLFKLRKSTLVRHSRYFAELFACDAEELEGVPHYYVAATSDTDFAVLLDALDNAV